jgi:hypothetical protein
MLIPLFAPRLINNDSEMLAANATLTSLNLSGTRLTTEVLSIESFLFFFFFFLPL